MQWDLLEPRLRDSGDPSRRKVPSGPGAVRRSRPLMVPRSDLLVDLVDAERKQDRQRFRALVEAVIAEERAKRHHQVADKLAGLLTTNGSARKLSAKPAAPELQELVGEVVPSRSLSDLVLDSVVAGAAAELVQEHHRADLLRSYGLEPRHRVLLVGPPGNGKTSLAEAIAAEAMLPMFVARYEGIISSFLGESAGRLHTLFEHVRSQRCVLFLDEFDTIAKERADEHETGEIKRLVSTLLLQIDRLPSHVVVICATNHAELLDRATWRRFQLRLPLSPPTRASSTSFLTRMESRLGKLGLSPRTIADKLKDASYAELEQFALDVRRKYVLDLPDANLASIAADKIRQWQKQLQR